MPSLLQYSNGWGHLIMSIVLLTVGLILILAPTDAATKAIGTGIITGVSSTWLITSTGNIIARQVQQNQQPQQPTQATPHA